MSFCVCGLCWNNSSENRKTVLLPPGRIEPGIYSFKSEATSPLRANVALLAAR